MKHKWWRVAGLTILLLIWGFILYHLLISGVDIASPVIVFSTLLWWFFRGDSTEFMQAASSCSRFLIVVLSVAFILLGILPALIRTLRAPNDGAREKDQPE